MSEILSREEFEIEKRSCRDDADRELCATIEALAEALQGTHDECEMKAEGALTFLKITQDLREKGWIDPL